MAFIMIVLILVVGRFIFAKGNNGNGNVVVNNEQTGEGQKIILSQKDLNYKDAVAETGLQIYKFGKTASMPAWQPSKGFTYLQACFSNSI